MRLVYSSLKLKVMKTQGPNLFRVLKGNLQTYLCFCNLSDGSFSMFSQLAASFYQNDFYLVCRLKCSLKGDYLMFGSGKNNKVRN